MRNLNLCIALPIRETWEEGKIPLQNLFSFSHFLHPVFFFFHLWLKTSVQNNPPKERAGKHDLT